MHVFQLKEVLEVAFDLVVAFTQFLGEGSPEQAIDVVAADDGGHAVVIDAKGPVIDELGEVLLFSGIVADGAVAQAADLLVLVNEHGVRAARIDVFPKFMSKLFQDLDQRDVVVAEDNEVDEQVHHEHNDQCFHDTLGVGQDAAKQGQQQRIHPVGRDMHQPSDHPPTGENHQDCEREIGQVSQQVRSDQEDRKHQRGEQVRDLGDGTSQGISGGGLKSVEVRHAAEEAGTEIGEPDREKAVVGVCRATEWIKFFDGGVAQHLLDHIDQAKHERIGDDLDQHLGRQNIEVWNRHRQLDG